MTVRLSKLLTEERPAASLVAWERRRTYDWSDFTGRVAALAERTAGEGAGSRWLLDVADAYDFAVALFGLALSGGQAVVPPNRSPGALSELAAGCVGAISDSSSVSEATALGLVVEPQRLVPLASPELRTLDSNAPLISVFTSGTTGQEKELPKTLGQLDEVSVLEQVFGPELPSDARVFASAPQQHLYGLLFRVLWPLAAARPFHTQTYLHPEEMLGQLESTGHSILVATPVHLRRLAGRSAVRALRGRLIRIFSSGGPLDPDTAASIAADLGESPAEIFGSTETGGVAWRQQADDGVFTPWQTLPGVSIRRDDDSGQLVVTSPYVSAGGPAPKRPQLHDEILQEFRMGDRCTVLDDGRFLLQGRADRVVKVGEKRLALPEMESRLCEHPWVDEVALLLIEQAGENRVAAVVVGTSEGVEVLVREGRRAIARALGEHLAQWWDRVLLPRAWRFVPELPRDARGKTPLAALRRLFDGSSDRRPRDPVLLEERRDAESIDRLLAIPTDLAQLEGHFEGFPIVAGVVQLGWAMDAVAALLGESPCIRAMEALKFHELLRPGDRAWVHVELSADRDRVYFRLSEGDRLFASGRCILEASA